MLKSALILGLQCRFVQISAQSIYREVYDQQYGALLTY